MCWSTMLLPLGPSVRRVRPTNCPISNNRPLLRGTRATDRIYSSENIGSDWRYIAGTQAAKKHCKFLPPSRTVRIKEIWCDWQNCRDFDEWLRGPLSPVPAEATTESLHITLTCPGIELGFWKILPIINSNIELGNLSIWKIWNATEMVRERGKSCLLMESGGGGFMPIYGYGVCCSWTQA